MAMAIETSIVRYVGTGAEVAEGALTKLRPPLGSTFYASDTNARYIYDGSQWAPLTASAAVSGEHTVQLLVAILAELQALRAAAAGKA